MNKEICNLKGSASIEFMQKAEQMKQKGEFVLSLAGGEPDFDTPLQICEAAFESIRNGETHYAVGKGILPLRKKIAEKLKKDNDISCNPDDIILTPGGKFGIYLAIQALINQGDEVIILSPSWVSYAPIVSACGGMPVSVELDYDDYYALHEEQIIANITDKTKAIIINYPNNPTGRILSELEAELLVNIVQKYDLYIISDEIYEKIVFDSKKNISIASYESIKHKVITINGFSKAYAMTGWRLGYTVAVKEITDVMYKLYIHTVTGISPFIQKAALRALDCEDEVQQMVDEYERRRNYFVQELNKINGISCRMPEGAFYTWMKFECDKSSEEMAELLLEKTGIVGVPGTSYGEKKVSCVRFSFATKMEVLEKAIDVIKSMDGMF